MESGAYIRYPDAIEQRIKGTKKPLEGIERRLQANDGCQEVIEGRLEAVEQR